MIILEVPTSIIEGFKDPAVKFIIWGLVSLLGASGAAIVFLVRYILTNVKDDRTEARNASERFVTILTTNKDIINTLVSRIETSDAAFAADMRAIVSELNNLKTEVKK